VRPPFFSVVIPTRNRPQYLKDAIASVLRQNDADLECIVSDNFNDASTRAVVDAVASDSRLRYFRTDRVLNMIDHWEFATRQASGEYVFLLTDRRLLFQGALRRLRGELSRRPEVDVFSVGIQVYLDQEHRMGWRPPTFPTRLYDAGHLARNFLQRNPFLPGSLDLVFPKTLNGGYRRAFADRLRAEGHHYFNNTGVTTPDYSSFFVNCARGATVLHVGDRLLLSQGEHDSNGRRFGAGDVTSYLSTLNIEGLYFRVPLAVPFIYNLLMVDYRRIQGQLGGVLHNLEPDWENYFRTLLSELALKRRSGVLSADQLAQWEGAWREACARVLGPGPADALPREPAPRPRRSLDVAAHVRDFVNHRFSRIGWVNRLTRYRFDRALDAAGF
jgi:glycosyltransferase involved in cell wall biosynthesis